MRSVVLMRDMAWLGKKGHHRWWPLLFPKSMLREENKMAGPKRSELLQQHGHAGGHLRDALLDALDYNDEWWKNIQIDFLRARHERWWNRLSDKSRAQWLLGQLWNCTDIVPNLARQEIRDWFPDDPEPFTYAQVARLLARDLKDVDTMTA
jgi:hypothetical protein